LLNAVSQQGGGRVVLVVGAGASFEEPTGLPLSRPISLEAYRRLVADGILAAEACDKPEDLSCVADAVVAATGKQRDLVERMPVSSFKLAEPNEGYLVAACLLRERAVSAVLTLNFDLGMTAALVRVGARDEIGIVSGPDEHHRLRLMNLIYLHRNANSRPEEWILRTAALETEWQGRWEEVVAMRVMAAPVIVFAGLGSVASVLVRTVERVRKAVASGAAIFLVDPGERGNSEFFARLELPDDAYLQLGWCSFAIEMGERLLEEHRHGLESACRTLIADAGWDDPDPTDLCNRVAALGLRGLGEVRARWTLDEAPYAPEHSVATPLVADLLLAVGVLERAGGCQAVFDSDGIVELRRGNEVLGCIAVATGGGFKRWDALEAAVRQHHHRRRARVESPRVVLVSGVAGTKPAHIAPPSSIVPEETADSIIDRGASLRLISAEELRASPGIADDIAA